MDWDTIKDLLIDLGGLILLGAILLGIILLLEFAAKYVFFAIGIILAVLAL